MYPLPDLPARSSQSFVHLGLGGSGGEKRLEEIEMVKSGLVKETAGTQKTGIMFIYQRKPGWFLRRERH